MVLIIKRMKKGVGSIIDLDHYQTIICLITNFITFLYVRFSYFRYRRRHIRLMNYFFIILFVSKFVNVSMIRWGSVDKVINRMVVVEA